MYRWLWKKSTESGVFTNFFSQSQIEPFFEKCSKINGEKRVVTIRKEVVEVIVKEMLLDEAETLAGDRVMAAATPSDEERRNVETGAMEKEVVCYTATIKNHIQFDYVVSLIAAGLSFNQISTVVKENRDLLGTAVKCGCVSPGEASNFPRFVCALCLHVMGEIMNKTWSFAIATDAWHNDFGNSHLDARV